MAPGRRRSRGCGRTISCWAPDEAGEWQDAGEIRSASLWTVLRVRARWWSSGSLLRMGLEAARRNVGYVNARVLGGDLLDRFQQRSGYRIGGEFVEHRSYRCREGGDVGVGRV